MKKIKIIPAVLSKKYKDIEDLSHRAVSVCRRVQIDICDGKFVPSMTWPFSMMSQENFLEIGTSMGTSKEIEVFLPEWESLNYTADLMCNNPVQYVESLAAYGFDELIFHYKTLQNTEKNGENLQEAIRKCKHFDIGLVLAYVLNSDSDLGEFKTVIKENWENIKYLQIMGIKKIGKQGEKFDENVLELIKDLQNFLEQEKIDLNIAIDGGVTEENIGKIHEAGVSIFTLGSYFQEGDLDEKYRDIKNLLR